MLLTLPPRSARLAPTVADLVARAIADTDFINDITPAGDMLRLAADYTDVVIDAWEEAAGVPVGSTDVPMDVVNAIRRALYAYAYQVQRAAELDAIDARADAIEAGDTDAGGEAIPYAAYRSARA